MESYAAYLHVKAQAAFRFQASEGPERYAHSERDKNDFDLLGNRGSN
jgi:hypothetical protein